MVIYTIPFADVLCVQVNTEIKDFFLTQARKKLRGDVYLRVSSL